jgi:chromosome segregation ATPase
MAQVPGFWSRLGRWLIGAPEELPLARGAEVRDPPQALEVRPRYFLRPFARRDAAISDLQHGFEDLAELLSAVRDNLERQGRRQDELIAYLTHLPEAVQGLPEAQRRQFEALRLLGQQLQQQAQHQQRLTEMVGQVHDAHATQRVLIESITGRVEAVLEHNDRLGQSLRQVAAGLQSVNQSADNGNQAVRQLAEHLRHRDAELAELLDRQAARLSRLLLGATVAAVVAVMALGATALVLWLRG